MRWKGRLFLQVFSAGFESLQSKPESPEDVYSFVSLRQRDAANDCGVRRNAGHIELLKPLTIRRASMEQRPINSIAMLLATLLLVAMALALALLAGPFGRTPTIRQQPGPYSQADAR